MFILELAEKLDGQQTHTIDHNAPLGRCSTETTIHNTEIGLVQTGVEISVHAFRDSVIAVENCEIVALNSNNHDMVEAMVLAYAQHHHDTDIAATIAEIGANYPNALHSGFPAIHSEQVRFTAGQYQIKVSRNTDNNTYGLEVWDVENSNMALNSVNIKSNRVVVEALGKIAQVTAQLVVA